MNILSTRVFTYADDRGDQSELVLYVYAPFEDAEWRCGFAFGPPIQWKIVYLAGVDYIQALLCCLAIARVYFESTDLLGRATWHGMLDGGLPGRAERCDPSNLEGALGSHMKAVPADVLTNRRVGYPDESGVEREMLLTFFVPFESEDGVWRCGFTLGSPESGSAEIRYGVGADFIDALLDSFASARVIFERMVPKGWVASGALLDCSDLPFKIGRSFALEPANEPPPDVPPASQ